MLCQITSIAFWLFWFYDIFGQSVIEIAFLQSRNLSRHIFCQIPSIMFGLYYTYSESLRSNFASLRVIIFLSPYFRYLSKEIIPKVLGFDFKRDFQSNFKTKLKENNLNTQWKWWTVCMPRLKRLIVPHSVKVKICTKYRKHWKSYVCFQLCGQTRKFLAVLKFLPLMLKYATFEGGFFMYVFTLYVVFALKSLI